MNDKPGVIINISLGGWISPASSASALQRDQGHLIHLTRQLAGELGPTRVVGIAPGLVKTDFAAYLVEHFGDDLARRMPTRRLGEPEDIANLAVFLASDKAAGSPARPTSSTGRASPRRATRRSPRRTLPRARCGGSTRRPRGGEARSTAASSLLHRVAQAVERRHGAARAGTTNAVTTWPHSSSGVPTTATSATIGVLAQHGLDRLRPDVLTAGDDQVAAPAVDVERGRRGAIAEVAGREPAVDSGSVPSR